MVKHYDFILAGGGLAGLSLAHQLVRSGLKERSMLIVDRDAKNRNDRTWCFWTAGPTPFDGLVQHEWSRLRFAGGGSEREIELGAYRYRFMRGIDFYRSLHQELAAYPNVEFVQGEIKAVRDVPDGAAVWANGQMYTADWVFDSCLNHRSVRAAAARSHYLEQHFKGWEIETDDAVFDPAAATLLDFRTPQKNGTRFFYVLPFSQRRALVEYVTHGPDNYDAALKAYIEKVLGITHYRVAACEGGINPLTDYKFPRRAGQRVLNIGARGGRIKPTSGYAFLRIQQDSAAIVRSLARHRHPFALPGDSLHYQFYDTLMLDVMEQHGAQIEPIFAALFNRNPIARVLRFLDEQGSLAENAALIASLPPRLFLQAIGRTGRQTTDDGANRVQGRSDL